jgi:hypothetical protein
MQANLAEIKERLWPMLHVPRPKQERWPGQVVRGYLAYPAVSTNARAITSFVCYVTGTGSGRLAAAARRDI